MIELNDDCPTVTFEDGHSKSIEVEKMEYEDRMYSINEMVNAIKQERKPVTDLNDNINSFAIVGAVLESIKQSKEILVQEFLNKTETLEI